MKLTNIMVGGNRAVSSRNSAHHVICVNLFSLTHFIIVSRFIIFLESADK